MNNHKTFKVLDMPAVPSFAVEPRIMFLRRQRVILDAHLAELYGVSVKRLNEQVKRNGERFPFRFHVSANTQRRATFEVAICDLKKGSGGRRYLPFVFTEHGAIMAATVLNSKRAVAMSVFVVRVFVRLREMLATNHRLAAKISELENRIDGSDEAIRRDYWSDQETYDDQAISAPAHWFPTSRSKTQSLNAAQFVIVARLLNYRCLKQLTRRRFLGQCCLVAAGMPLAPVLSGKAFATGLHSSVIAPSVKFPSAPRNRIAVASYPFREFIAGTDHKGGNPTIELKDFAAHVSEKFGIHKIEPWSAHFPSTGSSYLEQFRKAIEKAHATVVNLAADGDDSPYAADGAERERAVAFSKKWIDVAAIIGSPSVRTNIPEAKDAKPDIDRLAEALRRVAEYGTAKNVVVHLENDNPVSEDPFFLVQVIEKVNSPWLHALPDFGNTLNTHDEDYAYRAIDVMFAHSYGICHVKNGEVNPQGTATHVDLPRTFSILNRRHYEGYCSIEYDAPGDPYKATAELIEKTERYLSS